MYLNCHSYYSFKYGTFSPEQLLIEASNNRIESIALTDINNTSGILDFVRLAKKHNVKPVAGIDFRKGIKQKFVGIAKNTEGFRELNDFLSHYLHSGDDIPEQGPILFNSYIIYPLSTPYRELKNNEFIGINAVDLNKLIFSPWRKHLDKLVIQHPVSFRNKYDFNTHRLLRTIDLNTLLSKLPVSEQASPKEIMLDKHDFIKIYGNYPQIIQNTLRLLDNCAIDFEFGKNKNKKTFTGNLYEDELLLKKLCKQNLKYRYPLPTNEIISRYESEIKIITEYGFASYFLINWDIVNFAEHKNFFYVGRGSGANSIVAFLLKITNVDPVDLDLYFERFINSYRTSPPDFDIDFSWKDRDEVIQYIFKKHGKSNTAQLATYNTFQLNAVIRELGKVFGLPKAEIDNLSEQRKAESPDKIVQLIYKYAAKILDLPNHLSIHAGGILISELPMHYYTATVIPPKGFPLTQFSMLEAEDVGLYKFDILSQRGLGHIKDSVDLIKKNRQINVDIHNVQEFKTDASIRSKLKAAKCMGCFYIESPAMRMLLRKLEVETYLGLVAASSIIRPGVASSGMMKEYILRFKGMKPSYDTPKAIYDILKETYGVMVYQEDVIKVAHYYAGLTLGEADMLRRGMSGKYRGREEFEKVKNKFFTNCQERNYDQAESREIWRQIESFAGYAFSKGHSASYAVESYQSLFLKTYYPLEHMVSVINNFGGFYQTEFYVHEARMCGANIHAPDINKSEYLTCVFGIDIYIGFIHVRELEQKISEQIVNERNARGNYENLAEFMKRVSISVEQLRILIRVGAFRFTGRTKKQLLWDIYSIMGKEKKTVAHTELFKVDRKAFDLPPLTQHRYDDAMDEIEILGFPLASPFELLKDSISAKLNADEFIKYKGATVEIIGYLVTTKSTRTKRGDVMAFGTFIDMIGNYFDTTHFPKIYESFPFRGRGCYLIKGIVAEEFDFYSLEVIEMKRLDFISRNDLVES
jgi:DNA-directed DNA polymerase III PolC